MNKMVHPSMMSGLFNNIFFWCGVWWAHEPTASSLCMLRTLLSVIFQNLSFIMVLYELMNELKSRDARSIMRSGVTQLGTFRRYLIRALVFQQNVLLFLVICSCTRNRIPCSTCLFLRLANQISYVMTVKLPHTHQLQHLPEPTELLSNQNTYHNRTPINAYRFTIET